MKRVDQVLPRVVGEKRTASSDTSAPGGGAGGRDHVDAINQVFAELQMAYHNQFHKAYGEAGALALAKKYWLGVLADYPPQVILRGVRRVVRSSEYLPSLAAVVGACENAFELFGLPDAQAAYVEACCAPEPKAAQRWSHPAVFQAGRLTGWFLLASAPQSEALPLFEYNYLQLCRRVMRGEELSVPVAKALPEKSASGLSREENRERLRALREKFEL